MRTNYVLIDYENVQPTSMDALSEDYYKIILFHGALQSNVKIEIVTFMQSKGLMAEYIKIDGNGKDALDFHIAFYIGQRSIQEPDAFFHIISKDTGFDPLIKHLKGKKILACRSADIDKMPKPIDKAVIGRSVLNPESISKTDNIQKSSVEKVVALKVVTQQPTPAKKPIEKKATVEIVVENAKVPKTKSAQLAMIISSLHVKGVAMPKTTKALLNAMSDIFKKQLPEEKIKALFDDMQKKNIITINNTKVVYNLPKQVISTTKPAPAKKPIEKKATVKTVAENSKAPNLDSEKMETTISALKKRGEANPKTTVALLNAINHIFGNKLTKIESLSIFTNLKKQKIITVSDNMKVTYNLSQN